MTERDKILGRIREALRGSAKPSSHRVEVREGRGPAEYAAALPRVGGSFEERLVQFQTEAMELRADFRLLKGVAELPGQLRTLAEREQWKRLAAHHGALTDEALKGFDLPVLWTEDQPGGDALESAEAGITECDCLVAQTATVVLTSRSAGGRALSVLPPHHVVLARREQLIGGLPEAFALLEQRYGPSYPSMMSFITGPSRTGDIERILVLGAHGPKKLTILCV